MYTISHLNNLRRIVQEQISKESKNRQSIINNNTNNFAFKYVDIKTLTDDQYVIVPKIEGTFKFTELKHIMDIQRLKDESISANFTDEIKETIQEFIEFLDNQEDLKTKKKDKLLFLCPRTIGEYCPVCSFINSLKSLKNIPSIFNSSKFINRDDNELIEITKILNNVDKLVDVLPNNAYVIEQYYLPSVIFDEGSNTATTNLISVDKKTTALLSESLTNKLHDEDKGMEDVDNFTFKFLSGQTFIMESINLASFSTEFKEFINEHLQKLTSLNKMNIENRIFSNKIDKIGYIQTEFEKIFNNLSEKLCTIVEKISSFDGIA